MKLLDLIRVMELETKIHVDYENKEVYDGVVKDIDLLLQKLNSTIKCVWYSTLYNAIWIDI